MSDDDDFMQDSDDEKYRDSTQTLLPLLICHSYDFEYEDDDDAEQGGDVDVENKYYNAKQMKGDAPEEAIEEFLGVPALEQEKGDWGFKGLKQAIKLEFKLGRYDKVCLKVSGIDIRC
jgi:COP9 signalosome complex subunit 2